MRLIDADNFENELLRNIMHVMRNTFAPEDSVETCLTAIGISNAIRESIRQAPTVEIRQKGKWLYDEDSCGNRFDTMIECSACGCLFDYESDITLPNYCPHCGADMRGRTNEE